MRIVACWLVTLCVGVLTLSCGGRAEPDRSAEEVDALRALPYLNYSPSEAGDEQGVVIFDPELSYPGLNLVSHRRLCKAELFDESGQVRRTWQLESCHTWENAELLPMGDLFAPVENPDKLKRGQVASEETMLGGTSLVRMDIGGDVVWRKRLPVHHDIDLTPGGDLVTLFQKTRELPAGSGYDVILDNSVALLSLDGEVLDEISLYDLFAADPQTYPLREPLRRGGPLLDLFHANSVEWMHQTHLESKNAIYDRGNVLVCLRHQDMAVIIDWDKRELIWAWGGEELSGPHDATVLENGNILIFDNGIRRKWSRIVELDPVERRIVWEYKAPRKKDFYTESKGASQRLGNGNTLITNSDHGQVFEVTTEGDIVWEYLNPHTAKNRRAAIVRTKRYSREFIDTIQ